MFDAHGVSRIPSSAASNNATVAKATGGNLTTVLGFNATAGVKYLKLYNKATAPAPATDAALLKLVIALPPTTAFAFNFAGIIFPDGISYALVTGAADADNTAVAAADVLGLNVCFG